MNFGLNCGSLSALLVMLGWLLSKAESSGSDQKFTNSSSELLSEFSLSLVDDLCELDFAVMLVTLRDFRRNCEAKAAKSLTDDRLEAI